jgi:hypothetical protein
MRKIIAIIASGAMFFSSATASAGIARTSAPIGEREKIAGNPWVPWVVALIAGLSILFVVTDDDDEPQSP